MNIFYEEDGAFKVGAVLADNATSLQVESPHGKRSKIKAGAVLLRFNEPALTGFLEHVRKIADELDPNFLWECCNGGEFEYAALAREYFGRDANPVEAAGVLIRLHDSPMYFYKKGRGRFKPAPPEALKAALAAQERKRRQAEQQARYVEQLSGFSLPDSFKPLLNNLLYQPDKMNIQFKALEQACLALKLTPVRLLEKCGAVPSSRDYHLNGFLFEYFPRGTAFGEPEEITEPQDLPAAEVAAFSIDDATTTEIDDAFSVTPLPGGNLQIGIHIAVPALGVAVGSALDLEASRRLSTVYLPGAKITMFPDAVIERFTLGEEKLCPALSMYLEVASDYSVVSSASRVERVSIAANLRHASLEKHFNEAALQAGNQDYPFGEELKRLWEFANRLESARGKAEPNAMTQLDYKFLVENDRVAITERRRGTPIDKVVSELMICVNTGWGRLLAEADMPAIYRSQANGKVKLSTVPAPHQGIGAEQYIWASSPLRRYVDLVNQRQLLAMVRNEPAPYSQGSEALLTAMRDFDLAYEAYNNFQRTMERYWSLRWLLQENVSAIGGSVFRENLVKIDGLPLIQRVPSLPETPAGTRVALEVSGVDLLELGACFKFQRRLET